MKKLSQLSKNKTTQKDLLNSLSAFLVFGLIIFGVFSFLFTLGPEIRRGEGIVFNITQFFHSNAYFRFSVNDNELQIAVFVVSLTAGILQFSFLHRKNLAYNLLSHGISRKILFFNRALTPLAAIIFFILIPKLAALYLNISHLGFSGSLLAYFLYDLTGILSSVFASFTVAVFACVFAGRTVEAVAGALSITFLPIGIYLFFSTISEKFLFGFNSSNYSLLKTVLSEFEPFFGTLSTFYNYDYFDKNNSLSCKIGLISSLVWILVSIIVLFFLSKYFDKSFKAENIGFKGNSKFLIFVIGLTLPLIAASYIGNIIVDYLSYEPNTLIKILSLVGGSLAGAICAVVCNIFITFTAKKIKISLLSAGTIVGVAAIAVLFSVTQVFGTYNNIPKAEDISSIRISDPFSHFSPLSARGDYFFDVFGLSDYYTIEMIEAEDIQTVLEMHKAITENGKGDVAASFKVSYLLKNGTTVERHYEFLSEKSLPVLIKLWETPTARKTLLNFFSSEASYTSSENSLAADIELPRSYDYTDEPNKLLIYSFDNVTTSVSEKLSERDYTALKNAVSDDIAGMSAEEWFMPEQPAIGAVCFTVDDRYNYGNGYRYPIFVNEDMKNTIKALKSLDLYKYLEPQKEIKRVFVAGINELKEFEYPEELGEFSLLSQMPYFSNLTFNFHVPSYFDGQWQSPEAFPFEEITDKKEIKKLLDNCYMGYYVYTKGKIAIVEYVDDTYASYVVPIENEIYL